MANIMEAEQETQEDTQYEEETYIEEGEGGISGEQETEQREEYVIAGQETEQSVVVEEEKEQAEELEKQDLIPTKRSLIINNQGEDRSSFVHGLSVGLGMGCITTFVIMWITVFFIPQLPSTVTYEAMLSVFIYPLIYLLAVGLIALTAGIVREYYTRKDNF